MENQSTSGDASPTISGSHNQVTINFTGGTPQPRADGLKMVANPIPSRHADASYAVEVVVQFDVQMNELSLAFICDTEIVRGVIIPSMRGTFSGNLQEGKIQGSREPDKTYGFAYDGGFFPPIGPRNPLLVRLYSTRPITKIETIRGE